MSDYSIDATGRCPVCLRPLSQRDDAPSAVVEEGVRIHRECSKSTHPQERLLRDIFGTTEQTREREATDGLARDLGHVTKVEVAAVARKSNQRTFRWRCTCGAADAPTDDGARLTKRAVQDAAREHKRWAIAQHRAVDS